MQSAGSAFVHNLIVGAITARPEPGRKTPFLKAHTTKIVGLGDTKLGDVRFYNNLLVGSANLIQFDSATLPVRMGGNVFLNGAKPSIHEDVPLLKQEFNPQIKLADQADDGLYLELTIDKAWGSNRKRLLVTTELLGKAVVPNLPFESANGLPLRLNTDYFGNSRNERNPFPGPFELPEGGIQRLKVWQHMAN